MKNVYNVLVRIEREGNGYNLVTLVLAVSEEEAIGKGIGEARIRIGLGAITNTFAYLVTENEMNALGFVRINP